MQVDPARVLGDLRELDRLTGGPDGARRLCWSDTWVQARSFLRERLAAIDGVGMDEDEAGNLWANLPGAGQETEGEGVVAVEAGPKGSISRRGASSARPSGPG